MSPKPLYGRRLRDIKLSNKYPKINARIIVGPIAALTMAGLLFVYARSSVYAAKRNASKHREADGGQISWRNESQRRHGVLNKPEEPLTLKSLIKQDTDVKGHPGGKKPEMSREEQAVRERRVKRGEAQG